MLKNVEAENLKKPELENLYVDIENLTKLDIEKRYRAAVTQI